LDNAPRTTSVLRTAAVPGNGARRRQRLSATLVRGADRRRYAPAARGLLVGAALAVVALAAALAPAAAGATVTRVFYQGTHGHHFELVQGHASSGIEVTGTSDQTITLKRQVIWSSAVSGSSTGTGSVQWLADGSRLVCTDGQVEWLNTAGALEWSYTRRDNPGLGTAAWAWEFQGDDGHAIVIIADSSAGSVFAVDRTDSDKQVWAYSGSGAYGVSDPVCVEYVPHGTGDQPTVLIADDSGAAPKVIEVSWSDPSDVVWSYGGTPGTGANQLEGPTDVERESDGSTLIADAASGRVIRVNAGRDILWQYGAGATAGDLSDPMGAGLQSKGDTVIADTGHGRVISVRSDYHVDWHSATGAAGALGEPRLAERASGDPPSGVKGRVDGALLVCDVSGRQLALVGNSGGGNIDSKTFHLPTGGSQAHWLTLRVDANGPSGTAVRLYYTPSSGVPSEDALSPGTHSLRGVVSNTVKFNFWLYSTDRWLAPSLKDVVLTYTTGQTEAKTSGNGGASRGSGTASGAGTGTGTGVGGSGNGSGVGAGQGTSSDLGGSGTAASSGSTHAGGATLTVPGTPQPVASSAGGVAAGTVVGIPVNVGDLSGGARGGGGGSPPPRVSRAAARLWAGGAAALLVCLLGGPSVLVRRHMRRLGAIEHPDELGGWA